MGRALALGTAVITFCVVVPAAGSAGPTPAAYRAGVSGFCATAAKRLSKPLPSAADTVVRLKYVTAVFAPILRQAQRMTPPASHRAIHGLILRSLDRLLASGNELVRILKSGTTLNEIPKAQYSAVRTSLYDLRDSFTALRLPVCVQVIDRTAAFLDG